MSDDRDDWDKKPDQHAEDVPGTLPVYDLIADFEWYVRRRTSLMEEYAGFILLIHDRQLVEAYATHAAAHSAAAELYPGNNYFIQPCVIGVAGYSPYISRSS